MRYDEDWVRRVNITRVIDGDTVQVVIDLGYNIRTKENIRLWGINAPEIFTSDASEKERGMDAKAVLTDWVTRHGGSLTGENSSSFPFIMQTDKDKQTFNRYIGNIYCGDCGESIMMLTLTYPTLFSKKGT